MLRDGQKPVVIILNNGGYTVERAIHGANERYNDIASWDWTALPHALDAQHRAQSWRVRERVQLRDVFQSLSEPAQLSLVEVLLPKESLPALLGAVTAALEARNSGLQD